jgi:hypothetical protein
MSQVRRAPTAGSSARPPDAEGASLAALAGEGLERQFRSWRGRSGRRYVCSVYDPATCPPYEHALLMVAAVAPDDARRLLSIVDTGCFPEIVLAGAVEAARAGAPVEFHLHLLARSRAERAAILSDLAHLRTS